MISPRRTRQIIFILLLSSIALPVWALERGPEGTIRVGIFHVEPFNIIDKNKIPAGLNVDLLQEISKGKKWTPKFVPVTWVEGLDRLQKEEIDLMVSVAYSPERAEVMDYNHESVLELWGQAFIRPDGKVKNINDLAGRRVGVMRKDINGSNFIKTAESLGVQCEIVEFPSYVELFTAVGKKEVDAGIAHQHYGLRYAKEYNLVGSAILFSPFSIYFASKKGEHHELLGAIDTQLSRWKQDKDSYFYERVDYWLGGQSQRTKIPAWLMYATLVVAIALLIFVGFTLLLKRTVRIRTQELKEKHEAQQGILSTTLDGFWLVDNQGNLIDVNMSYVRMSGYSREELLKMRISDLEAIESSTETADHIRRIRETGSDQFETIHRRKDGSTWNLEITATYSTLRGGQLFVFARDITERKQAETKLVESEGILRDIVESTLSGFWDWNLSANTEYLSPTFKRMFGYEDHEMENSPEAWQKIIFPEDLPGVLEVFDRHVKSRGLEPFYKEIRYRHRDGSTVWVICAGRVIEWAENGAPIRMVGCHIDITERKQAEEAVKKSNKLLQTIINTAPVRIFYKDSELRYMGCNIAFARDAGVGSPEDLVGKDDYQLAWKEQAELYRTDDLYVLESGIAKLSYDEPQTTPEGKQIWLRTSKVPLLDNRNEIIGILGMYEDITDHKKDETDKTRLLLRQRAILDNLPMMAWLKDTESRLEMINQPYAYTCGRTIDECIGKTDLDLFPEEMAKGFIADDREVCRSGRKKQAEEKIASPDGIKWLLTYKTPIFDEHGSVIGTTGIAQDITERKQAEAERENLQARLQQAQKMEAIGTLAGGIAHDFNNILGAILGYAEMVQEDSPAGSSIRKDIDQVLHASHRAKNLVKQILAFSRQAATDHVPLQPGVIIKEALKMLRSSLPTTINIKQDIDPEAGLILADPTQIHQVIVNLCTNAFHAMEETGGILSISLKKKTLSTDDLANESRVQPGDFVQLSIGDTGPGIAPEIRDKIFDPYFTTKEVGKGTGMGLAIIHGIVKSYKGFTTCHSGVGKGTVFDVYLPVIADPDLLTTEPAPLDLPQLGTERILFIDDEEILAEMGQAMLERLGYRVTVRKNSLEALNTFQNQPDQFDLVITDQTMPGMTGSDLARRMLQIRPGMPIILCTGYSSLITEDKAKSLGIKGFAMKPLAKKDIAVIIRKVLDEVR